MSGRNYVVKCKRGRMEVFVFQGAIDLRGEREAVAQAAWKKLLGQNELGELVDKKSPTRKILVTEMLSNYEQHRKQVYEQFKAAISFTWMSIER